MKWARRLWWLFTDRTVEYDLPDDIDTRLAEKVNAELPLKFGEAWALLNPHPLWRFGREMPCGCTRLPWRKRPFVMAYTCPAHGLKRELDSL